MSIKVVTMQYQDSTTVDSVTFAEGANLTVADGHLFVVNNRGTYLGMFAPGKWVYVYKEGEAVVADEEDLKG